ncbi:MAG: RNA methyltransferase [Gammaproteobacteria bacterium]
MKNDKYNKIRIVMVNTTEPGNIGAAARAMKNMALTRLYLVNPSSYPSATATARASGADDVLFNAKVCGTLEEALDGVSLVIGASARQRRIKWRQLDVVESCSEIDDIIQNNQEVAVVFGTEKSGLSNEELDLCQVLMTIPGNPEYFSLNVASAIQVFAYQNFIYSREDSFDNDSAKRANFESMEVFYDHLSQVLEHIEYFEDKRPKELLMRRLRRFFSKAEVEEDELGILRGILRNIKPYRKKQGSK